MVAMNNNQPDFDVTDGNNYKNLSHNYHFRVENVPNFLTQPLDRLSKVTFPSSNYQAVF